jgi:leucyl-tRNA synthetase
MVDWKNIEQKWQERWTEAAAKFKATAPVIHKALEAQIH